MFKEVTLLRILLILSHHNQKDQSKREEVIKSQIKVN